MTKRTEEKDPFEALKGRLREVFGLTGPCNSTTIKVEQGEREWTIIISQMYEYIDVQFVQLRKFADLVGTDDFNADRWSGGGCETCDYGSSYTKVFTGQGQLPILKDAQK